MSSQSSWVSLARLLAFAFWLLSGLLWFAIALALLKNLIHWEWDFYLPAAIPMFIAAIFLPFIAQFLWVAANKRQGL